jgi:hypothetical protein
MARLSRTGLSLLLAAFALLALTLAPSVAAAGHGHSVKMRAQVRNAATKSVRLSVVSQSLSDGATISGNVSWEVRTRGARVSRVDFAIDGAAQWSDHSSPYLYGGGALDTTKLSNGAHTLTATVNARNTRPASASVTVNVSNHTAPVPAPAPAPAAQPAPTPASNSIYWGAWIGNQLTGTEAPWDMNAAASLEQKAGKKLSIVNFSAPFANCGGSSCSYYNFPAGEFNNIRSHGSIPFYSWGSQSIPVPSNLSEPNFQLSDVIEGRHDTYIRAFATAAKKWGYPFFLRFNWEMNGGWFAWAEGVNGNKTGEFVAAWRHVHDIFTEVGATNATWVWCPNVNPGGKMTDLASLYPGDQYVDWTGLDGYNWGTNPAHPDKWRSFDDLYRATYDEITTSIAPGKPLMISEIGSTESGGSKSEWIADAIESALTEYPQVRGLLWFEKHDDGMDWPIESSSSSAAAFAAGIQNPAFAANSFASQAGGPIAPLG